jgi:hypothetical protein
MMRGKIVIAVLMMAAIVVTSAVAASTSTPILIGSSAPHSKGYGHVKPGEIYNGGDPSGLICRIHWLSWGGSMAIGSATGLYIGPHQTVSQGRWAPAVVVLLNLGTWRGRPAYKAIDEYFPGHSGSFATAAGVSPCTA